jgi:hypothetical protein
MNSEELEELKKLSGRKFGSKLRFDPELKKKCLDYLDFLDHEPDNMEIFWYIQNGLMEQASCPVCKKLLTIKRGELRTCSQKCGFKIVDKDTGLTKAQTHGKKVSLSKKRIDEATGLTIGQLAAQKAVETRKTTINPETGKILAEEINEKISKTLTKKDSNGVSKAQIIALKSAATRKATGPDGLSIAQKAAKKAVATRKTTINPETGRTIEEESGIKRSITSTALGPDGLSIAQKAAKKAVETKKTTINPETGRTIEEEAIIKARITKTVLGPDGLSIAQKAGKLGGETRKHTINEEGISIAKAGSVKGVITKNKINPMTGLTVHQEIGKRVSSHRNSINPKTGLSYGQEIAIKSAKTNVEEFFKNFVEIEKELGYEILTSFEEYHNSSDKSVLFKHTCGEMRKSHHKSVRCLKCYPYNISIGEAEVLTFCKSLVDDDLVSSNDRETIKPIELDIVIPDYGLAIEYNGLFWHSSDDSMTEKRDYHLEKTLMCEEKSLNLLHIFENEWESPQKRLIWKSIIRNKLGKSNKIYARKCEIREVSNNISKSFLENNHLQGNAPASVRYGLYQKDILVALMTFGKSRFNKKIDWELIRYCNMLDNSVVGGASRLFKHFLKNNTGSIISYADRRHSQGGLYENLGFEFSHNSDPNYYYYKNKQPYILESRQKYQKHKLKTMLENFDPNQTESENMYKHGYRKIYDCGNQVWVYERLTQCK